MRYIDSRSIGAISSVGISGLNASVVTGAGVFSLLFGAKKNKRLTRSQRKKISARRYRRFVDNIVMHHRRLHDRNRAITINLVKSRVLDSQKKKKDKTKPKFSQSPQLRWQDRFDSQSKAIEMRARVSAKRSRAKSRWLTILMYEKESDKSYSQSNPEEP